MEQRELGRTGRRVSVIGFGAWQLPADGAVGALERAVDRGVGLVDLGAGTGRMRAARLVARLAPRRRQALVLSTTLGARRGAAVVAGVERLARAAGADAIDLVHVRRGGEPDGAFDEALAALEAAVDAGTVRHIGVDVERAADALPLLGRSSVQSVRAPFDPFRPEAADVLLPSLAARGATLVARVRLPFDRGAGSADLAATLRAARRLLPLVPPGMTLAGLALRWALAFPAVAVAVPDARTLARADEHLGAADLAPLDLELVRRVASAAGRGSG